MTIQIDDAGWGTLVGGMLIGVARVVPGQDIQFEHGVVAPKHFQETAFGAKAYLPEATRVVAECFQRLQVQPDEPVRVCTGYALEGIRDWLTAKGYDWQPAKIEGPLQDAVEGALKEYLASLGFNVNYEMLTQVDKKGLLWWQQIRWLKGGDVDAREPVRERAALCKTGWASFEIWARYPYKEAKQRAKERREQRRSEWR
jgi:hypothetical protein